MSNKISALVAYLSNYYKDGVKPTIDDFVNDFFKADKIASERFLILEPPPKKETDENDMRKGCITSWQQAYKDVMSMKTIVSEKDIGIIGQIIDKIKRSCQLMLPNPIEPTPDIVVGLFKKILDYLKQDPYYYDKFTLSTILSQYDNLVVKIKNRKPNPQTKQIDEYKQQVAEAAWRQVLAATTDRAKPERGHDNTSST